jgi:hypothetical protein
MDALAGEVDAVMHVNDIRRLDITMADQHRWSMTPTPGLYPTIEPEAPKGPLERPPFQPNQLGAGRFRQLAPAALGKDRHAIAQRFQCDGLFESVATGAGALFHLTNGDHG